VPQPAPGIDEANAVRFDRLPGGRLAHDAGAVAKYLEQRDDLHAGRTPRVQGDGLTVRDLLNRFLTVKKDLMDAGEITPRTFAEYKATCEHRFSSQMFREAVVPVVTARPAGGTSRLILVVAIQGRWKAPVINSLKISG
jgi:hypothetical protein